MRWKRPYHDRWAAACLVGLVIAAWVGGFSLSLAVIFVIIFAVGAALITLEDPDSHPAPTTAPADEAPVDEAPADEAPADEAPSDEAPVGEVKPTSAMFTGAT